NILVVSIAPLQPVLSCPRRLPPLQRPCDEADRAPGAQARSSSPHQHHFEWRKMFSNAEFGGDLQPRGPAENDPAPPPHREADRCLPPSRWQKIRNLIR